MKIKLMKKEKTSRKYLFLIFFIAVFQMANGQELKISGTVTGEENLPLPGANVMLKGSTIGTSTNTDGKYSIDAKKGDVLVFSFVGYQPIETKVNNASLINVHLSIDEGILNEVVVTGYGQQTREKLTTSISKLDTRILETSTRSNAATALQGTVAGLRVTNNTGQPGSTPSIIMRGGTNFDGSGSPLILVDGIPSSFYALNPDDIESMEVLKDAAATAIYGARSANGVILITTKTGKKGKSSINYKYRYSVNQERDDQKYLSGIDFLNYNRQSIAYYRQVNNNNGFSAFLDGAQSMGVGGNTLDSPFTTQYLNANNQYLLNQPGWNAIPDILNPDKQILFYDNPTVGDRIYQESFSKDHYLSFDGGNEEGTYFLGLGALENDGLILGSGFTRYSAKFGGSYKVTNDVKVNTNILYSHSNLGLSGLGDDNTVFRRFQGQAPTSRTYDNNPDGTLSNIYAVGQNQGFGNPLYYYDKFIRKNLEQRLSANLGFEWAIMKDLTMKVNASHFSVNNHNEYFEKEYRKGSNTGPLTSTRNASVGLNRTLRNQLTTTLGYLKNFGDHNFNFLLGAEYFSNNDFSTSAGTRNSPTDLIQTLNAAPEANGIPNSFETEYRIISNFGRVLYDYNDRFLMGLTYRYDGSSRLGENKFGFFPGVSFGWNAHNEEFFKNSALSSTINRLKPRLSYGINGNQDVLSNYGVFGSYGSQGVYAGQTGYANTSLPTLGLLWEKATTLNAGLDVSFFNNRLSIITDIYSRDIVDKLASLTLPYYTGFSSITTNNGTIRNKGFEFQLSGDIIRNKDISWNIGANFTTNKNFVIKLPENSNDLNRQGGQLIWNVETGKEEWVGGLQEGQRSGSDLILAFIQEKIYATQSEADADNGIKDQYMPGFSRNKRWAGDVKWKDVNGDGIIDQLDRQVIGRATPILVGGFTSNFRYKNFSLYLKTDFAVGHLVWNHIKGKGYGQTQGNLNQPIEMLDSWTPTNTETDWPRMVFVNASKNVWRGNEGSSVYDGNSLMNAGNNQFWEKGDYIAIREVTFSYDLPAQYLKNRVKGLSIFATGSNLHYFKKSTGDTPEIGGVQYGAFPMPKTLTIGANVTF